MEKIIVSISGPSGSGKNTILNEILKLTNFVQTPHATTRNKRGENDNEYIFLNKEEFLNKVQTGEIIEYTEFANNYYGTLKPQFQNNIMILDHIGVEFIKEYAPKNGYKLITILLYVDENTRRQRIIGRGDDHDIIEKRLENDLKLIENCSKLCKHIIDTSNKTVQEVLEETLKRLDFLV